MKRLLVINIIGIVLLFVFDFSFVVISYKMGAIKAYYALCDAGMIDQTAVGQMSNEAIRMIEKSIDLGYYRYFSKTAYLLCGINIAFCMWSLYKRRKQRHGDVHLQATCHQGVTE